VTWPAWLGLLTRGTLVCVAYPLLLLVLGFYHRDETQFVIATVERLRNRNRKRAVPVRETEPVAEPDEPAVDVTAAMPATVEKQ
jgi:hypothetical protein